MLLWIPATLAASVLQVGRNALQRGLLPKSGPWAATLVRFLFGLPFALVAAVGLYAVTPGATVHLTQVFWLNALTGAVAQVLATACLLVAMRRAGFAVGTSMQQSSLPLAAVLGLLVFHDQLTAGAWTGVALRSVFAAWRESLAAGFCGAIASICWLLALGLAPAAPVRALGVVEAPVAAVAGRRMFKEKLSLIQWIAGAAVAFGVAMTALG